MAETKVQFAQKAVIIEAGKILLIRKGAGDPYQPLKWEIPGGRLESGESLDEHIKREVREEVGLEIEAHEPLAIWSWTLNTRAEVLTVVAVSRRCSALTTDISLQSEGDCIVESNWVDLSDVRHVDLIPNARAAILESIELVRRRTTPHGPGGDTYIRPADRRVPQ
ncbi:NUDIX domain-containing protein [Streptomyces sp. SAI-127]|uniref:NUDIX domain-containing protein n=1 Tax=Streptomyces sp. SAI-127 TaxID=2940543 RepID=UPI002476083B|nr:NUDIX domain-containing protein [Streptomyces sp. SAI-127]MDH6484449.1 mutator protein MutT [Streptomyces sp. SAI-127]